MSNEQMSEFPGLYFMQYKLVQQSFKQNKNRRKPSRALVLTIHFDDSLRAHESKRTKQQRRHIAFSDYLCSLVITMAVPEGKSGHL